MVDRKSIYSNKLTNVTIKLKENKGQIYCHNTLVINAKNDFFLMLNDDNVVGEKFDEFFH